jgi:hypothetical protein
MGFSAVRRAEFRAVSQTRIRYPDSPLSAGHVGDAQGGDRLPWVEELDNFTPLRARDWHIQVYGEGAGEARDVARQHDLAVWAFGWTEGCGRAGLRRDALYLVRPDGHVAVATTSRHASAIAAFLDRWGIGAHAVQA